jgi:tetratricopeptide (TPR) repeat protein
VGSVDDITLNELILSHKIGQFYRPSQEKWINTEMDPVRIRKGRYGEYKRRGSDEEEGVEGSQEKPRGLLSKMLRRKRKTIALKKALTAGDWFERGFRASQEHDDKGAVRAFAKSIDLDPVYQSAYLHRGITYEMVGNLQQSVYDYSKVIELAPGDAEVYYLRGLARKRLGMEYEAIEDLKKAARMGYKQALGFFKSKGVYL